MAVLDAFYSVGYLIGLPLGTYIKKEFGYVPLFSLTLGLVICAMIYTAVFIKDSYHLITEDQRKVFDAKQKETQCGCSYQAQSKEYAVADVFLLISVNM